MPLYENPAKYLDYPVKSPRNQQNSDSSPQECDFCALLRRRFLRQQVTLYIDCRCCPEQNTISGYVTYYSFEDGVVKLFNSPVGGSVSGLACCSDIYCIQATVQGPAANGQEETPDNVDEPSL